MTMVELGSQNSLCSFSVSVSYKGPLTTSATVFLKTSTIPKQNATKCHLIQYVWIENSVCLRLSVEKTLSASLPAVPKYTVQTESAFKGEDVNRCFPKELLH